MATPNWMMVNLLRFKNGNLNFESWVPVNSTGNVSNGWIKDLEFDPYLYQKLINVKKRNFFLNKWIVKRTGKWKFELWFFS